MASSPLPEEKERAFGPLARSYFSDFFLRLFETGALVLRAPREAVFAAARLPADFARLFEAVPELLFDRAAVLFERAELERLDAALVERPDAGFDERPLAVFAPPRALLRAAVLPDDDLPALDLVEVDLAAVDLPEREVGERDFAERDLAETAFAAPELRAGDLRAAEPRLEPDAALAPEARVVRFAVLFAPCDFVAPRALLLAAVRFVPEVEREAAVFVPLLRLPPLREPDFAAVLRALEPVFAELRRVLEPVLFFVALFWPDALS